MPLAKRVVSPVRLGRKPISEEDKFDKTVVCNNTLVGVLQQLSSLAYYADELFNELNQESVTVIRRTSSLVRRVEYVGNEINNLDFKTVKIPAGDLKTYKEVPEHFKTEYGLDTLLFAATTRPDCVIDLYDASALSPIQAIRECNSFRKDGKTGSKLFSLAPVVREDALYGVDSEIDINSPLHHGDFERKPREPKSVKQRPRSLSTLKELEAFSCHDGTTDMGLAEGSNRHQGAAAALPSSQSVDLVPIDVTGSGFTRMCEYRESIRTNSREYIEESESCNSTTRRRRHRRRQTVSGIPLSGAGDITHGFIVQSENDLRIRSVSRERLERPKSMAYMDRYAPRAGNQQKSREELRREKESSREEPGLARSCSLRRSMKSLFRGDKEKSKSTDLWVHGRPESPGPPMVDLDYPLRRSKSLPRSLKAMSKSLSRLIHSRSASTEGRLDSRSDEELEKPRKSKKYSKPKLQDTGSQNAMEQGFVTVVSKSKKPKSLRKNLTKRMSKSQSQVNQQAVSGRPPLPLNFTPKHSPRQQQHNKRLNRPKSLECGLVLDAKTPPQHARQQHQAIPAHTPVTPSGDSVFTPSPTAPGSGAGAIGMKKHRLNIPPGQAWKAFGEIHYRGGGGGSAGGKEGGQRSRGERQSSSGHWSATDSSVRYSTESDYPRSSSSPERGSLLSGDRDSAISFNMQDMHNVTTDNNPEDDTSTVNGDTSTFIDDGSTVLDDSDDTLNGSVVNMPATKVSLPKPLMSQEEWLNSLSRTKDTKEMKDRRRRRRSRKDRDKGATSSPGSAGGGLTVVNMQVHDGTDFVDRRARRGRGVRGDEASSVYSQDTDGFYTSMHTDSGLKHSSDNLINDMDANTMLAKQNGLQGVTVPITLHSNSQRSDSFRMATNGGIGYSKSIPPPPPRRSSTLSKDNRCHSSVSSSIHEDELDRILASSFSLNSSKSNDSKESRLSQCMSETSSHMDESLVSESDPELIYTRVKDKTCISTAGYPSLCSVTPLNSEDEDRDMLAFSREWRNRTAESVTSSQAPTPTPESENNRIRMPTSTPMVLDGSRQTLSALYRLNRPHPGLEVSRESSGTEKSLDESSMSWEFDISGMDLIDTSIYSTLPRKNVEVETPTEELEDEAEQGKEDHTEAEQLSRFGAATYVPSLRMFNVGSLEILPTVRQSLPQVKTPDGLLDDNKRAISTFSNTFHIPSDHKFTFDTDNITAFHGASPPPNQSSPAGSKTSASSIIQDKQIVTKKPPFVRKLDKVESFHVEQSNQMAAGSMSTWPRKKDSPCSPTKCFDDSELNSPTIPATDKDFEMDEKSWTNTFPRKKNKKFGMGQNTVPESLDLNVSLDQPLPSSAKAQLIISSPVANQAEYVDNPHIRSLCSPVTDKDLVAFSQFNQNNTPLQRIPAVLGRSVSGSSNIPASLVKKSSTMFEFSSPSYQSEPDSESASAFRPVSKPLYPTLSSMKHSISFPEKVTEKLNPSNYDRTWYDGVNRDAESVEKSSDPSVAEDRLSQAGFPFAAFLNDSFLSTLESSADTKRQSLISNNSTSSSGSGKKSVTFASDLRSSENSLNKSDSVSVSSTHTTGTDYSYNSKISKNSSGILTSFKKKSLESLKSTDSQKSVHSNESVKLRSGKVVQVDLANASSLRRTGFTDSRKSDTVNLEREPLVPSVKPETSTPEKTVCYSPQKRSSAIFDDDSSDVDMYSQVMQQHRSPLKKPSGVHSDKISRSCADDLPPTGLSQNVKRQCTNNTPKIKSPARSTVTKKNRLKRTPSKPSVRPRTSGDACEVVNMGPCGSNFSPSKKGFDQQPFSSIIMKSAPSRVTVTLPFEFSPQKEDDICQMNTAEENVKPKVDSVNVVKAPVYQNPVHVRSSGNGRVVVNVQHLDDTTEETKEKWKEPEAKKAAAMVDVKIVPKEKGVIRREVSLSSFSPPGAEINNGSVTRSLHDASGTGISNPVPLRVNQEQKDNNRQSVTNSAFTEVLENKGEPTKPSPPKFVLPKLRSLSKEPNQEKTKGTASKNSSETPVSRIPVKSVHNRASAKESQRASVSNTSKVSQDNKGSVTNIQVKGTAVHAVPEHKHISGNNNYEKQTIANKTDNKIRSSHKGSDGKKETVSRLERSNKEGKQTSTVNNNTEELLEESDMGKLNDRPPKPMGKIYRKSISVSDKNDAEILEKENRFVSGKPPHPPRVEQKSSLRPDSSYGSTTSLNYMNSMETPQIGQANPLTKSLTNLSCLSLYRGESSFSLAQSSYSLARSTDSLASTSSERADKVKAAKLAFLEQQNENIKKSTTNLDQRFATHAKKLSASRTSLSSMSCVNFSSNDSDTKTTDCTTNRANVIKPLSDVPQRQQDNQNNKGSGSNTDKSGDVINRTDDVIVYRKTTLPLENSTVSNNHKSAQSISASSEKRKSRHLVDNASSNPVPGKLISSLLNKFQK